MRSHRLAPKPPEVRQFLAVVLLGGLLACHADAGPGGTGPEAALTTLPPG